jgi:hypothetical protein
MRACGMGCESLEDGIWKPGGWDMGTGGWGVRAWGMGYESLGDGVWEICCWACKGNVISLQTFMHVFGL